MTFYYHCIVFLLPFNGNSILANFFLDWQKVSWFLCFNVSHSDCHFFLIFLKGEVTSSYCQGPAWSLKTWLHGCDIVVFFFSETGCTQCSAGKYCIAGSTTETDCPAGQYSAAGAGSCTACSAGFYCTSTAEIACDPGTYSLGSTTSCTNCPAGMYCKFGKVCEGFILAKLRICEIKTLPNIKITLSFTDKCISCLW